LAQLPLSVTKDDLLAGFQILRALHKAFESNDWQQLVKSALRTNKNTPVQRSVPDAVGMIPAFGHEQNVLGGIMFESLYIIGISILYFLLIILTVGVF
jgi:hypothetical protein